MIFWLWIVIGVLVFPPIAVGLAFAVAYLYVRWNHTRLLDRLFPKRDG